MAGGPPTYFARCGVACAPHVATMLTNTDSRLAFKAAQLLEYQNRKWPCHPAFGEEAFAGAVERSLPILERMALHDISLRYRHATVAGIKERLEREMDVLKAQRELARYNLRLIEGASAGAWAELVQGADDAWDRMRLAVEAAATYFGEPVERKAGTRKRARRQ